MMAVAVLPDHHRGVAMSHPEQLAFFSAVARANVGLVEGARVVEIGAYDVNGSVRSLFDGAITYVGVDLQGGAGVDVVAYGHEFHSPTASFDIAISGECFEHDPYWAQTFGNMCRLVRPGGLVAFTCASRGRPEHGTRRTELRESPGTQAVGLDYYRNLEEEDFQREVDLSALFQEHAFWYMPTSFDLYFAGVRSGPVNASASLPLEDEVSAIRGLMSLPHRAARLPLRIASRMLPSERYQDLITPYWTSLLRLQDRAAGGRFRRTPSAGDPNI